MKPNTKQRDAKLISKRHSKVCVDGGHVYLTDTAVGISLQSAAAVVVNKVATPPQKTTEVGDKKSCNK